MTKLDAIILKLINDAGSGNAKALTNTINLMKIAGLIAAPDEPTHQEPLTADDPAIIAQFLKRNGSPAESEAPSESPKPPQNEGGKDKEAKS